MIQRCVPTVLAKAFAAFILVWCGQMCSVVVPTPSAYAMEIAAARTSSESGDGHILYMGSVRAKFDDDCILHADRAESTADKAEIWATSGIAFRRGRVIITADRAHMREGTSLAAFETNCYFHILGTTIQGDNAVYQWNGDNGGKVTLSGNVLLSTGGAKELLKSCTFDIETGLVSEKTA